MGLLPDIVDGEIIEEPTDEELARADFEVVERIKGDGKVVCVRK